MPARQLNAHDLAVHCDAGSLGLDGPVADAVSPGLAEIVGQERARAAVEFAISMRSTRLLRP